MLVLTTLLTAQAGGTCVIMDRLDAPGIAAWIRDERITTWNGVPAMLSALATDESVTRDDLASLVEVWSGGDSCPDAIRRSFTEKFGLAPTSTYGLTEAPTVISIDDVDRPGECPGSSGRPLPHVEVTIRTDDDEIVPHGRCGRGVRRAESSRPVGRSVHADARVPRSPRRDAGAVARRSACAPVTWVRWTDTATSRSGPVAAR